MLSLFLSLSFIYDNVMSVMFYIPSTSDDIGNNYRVSAGSFLYRIVFIF